jgi:mono/diheme cytochrome c family protein
MRLSRTLSVVAALGMSACASSAGPEAAPAPAPAPTAAAPAPATGSGALAGVYATAQANRGRDQFRSMCAECHTPPEYSDAAFKAKWARRTVGDLFEYILTNMPDNAPGILTPQQAVDLVSYILQLNEIAPGSAQLPPDVARLRGLSLAPIRG